MIKQCVKDKEKNKILYVRLDEDLKEKVFDESRKLRCKSAASFVREVLKLYFKNK